MARKPRKGATKAFLKAINNMTSSKHAMVFKTSDLVTHTNHGDGKVIAISNDSSSIIVEFDKAPDGWDKVLEVSIACLKKR